MTQAKIDMVKFREVFMKYTNDTPVCIALTDVMVTCIDREDLINMPDLTDKLKNKDNQS